MVRKKWHLFHLMRLNFLIHTTLTLNRHQLLSKTYSVHYTPKLHLCSSFGLHVKAEELLPKSWVELLDLILLWLTRNLSELGYCSHTIYFVNVNCLLCKRRNLLCKRRNAMYRSPQSITNDALQQIVATLWCVM